MRSILGLRADTSKPSPLEGSGAFRALQAESELQQLGKSEGWLWFSACAGTLLAIAALVLSFLPFLFRHANHFYEILAAQAHWGTAGLLVVFNAWMSYRQWSFLRARKRVTAEQNPSTARTANEIADP